MRDITLQFHHAVSMFGPTGTTSSSLSVTQNKEADFEDDNINNKKLALSPRSKTKEVIAFNQRASLISKGIHLTSVRLSKLANLVKGSGNNSNNLFGGGDPAQEINQLAISVKEDIALLNTQISDLQSFIDANTSNGLLTPNETSRIHSKEVVKTMELRLHDTGTKFQTVLEQRKSTLQHQYERRGQFVGSKASGTLQLGKPIQFTASSSMRQRVSPNTQSPSVSPRIPNNGGMTPDGGNIIDEDDDNEQNLLIIKSDNKHGGKQQMQMQQNQNQFSYLESRVDAVRDIESHIVELGKVMGTLATMIAEQDHAINEISSNIDGANENIFSGVRELQKMYQGIQNNKRLFFRLLAVLIVFLTFFIFFAA